jgi:uncharacterized membrane protein
MQKLGCYSVLGVALLAMQQAPAAQFIPLSDLVPGIQLSEVRDVSNDGSTVVGSYSFDGVTGRPFRWRLGVGLVELLRPNLEPINGNTVTVSADGRKILGVDADFGPFLWTEGVGTEYLNLFATDVHQVTDMSADGSVIVGEVRRESPQGSYYEAFRWRAANGVTIIDALPESNGGHPSGPNVSDDGTTVVGNHSFFHPDHSIDTDYAFRWTESEGTVSLGSPSGTTRSLAIEASADGSEILGQSFVSGSNSNHFRWRDAPGFEMLGPHPDAAAAGMAYSAQDITPDGDLIVGSAVVSEGSPIEREPFVWDEVRRFRSLRTILDSATGTPLTGWHDLGIADAISADGTVIAGYGKPNSSGPSAREQGWVMLFEPIEIDPPLGDYNRDGIVDAADYVVWRKLLGDLVQPCSGPDANCNGFVDNTDYQTWRSDYGRSVIANVASAEERQSSAAANVPEPASLPFYLLAPALMVSMRRVGGRRIRRADCSFWSD